MKTCYIYTRTATFRHKTEHNSLENQEKVCKRYALKHGLHVIQTFKDAGSSGSNLSRTGYIDLLEALKKHPVDNVLVYRLDRITRSYLDYQKIQRTLKKSDTGLISTTEGDFNSPTGRFMSSILASLGEYERSIAG